MNQRIKKQTFRWDPKNRILEIAWEFASRQLASRRICIIINPKLCKTNGAKFDIEKEIKPTFYEYY